MIKVWTQAGLSRRENKLFTPVKVLDIVEPRAGELPRDEDEDILSGDGRRWFEFRLLRGVPARPDSKV